MGTGSQWCKNTSLPSGINGNTTDDNAICLGLGPIQDTNQCIGNLVGWIVIYIIHKQYRHKIKRLQLSKDTVPNHRVFT